MTAATEAGSRGDGARAEILGRIRTALTDRPDPSPVQRTYRQAGSVAVDLALFVERVSDYKATVHRLSAGGDVAAEVGKILTGRGCARLVVPDGMPGEWTPDAWLDGAQLLLTVDELATADGVLTSCALGIAETGTIVLDAGPGQGRRALTLIPDYHLVVIRAEQVLAAVPDAVAGLQPGRPQTWISGPSATSDIELERVEGVHGPRTLDVLIVE
jgi:L-lactate dehydrogenase complex protein LldG